MHEPLLTIFLVGAASAVATVAFFGAITIHVRKSLFPGTGASNVTEQSDYGTAYFGQVQ